MLWKLSAATLLLVTAFACKGPEGQPGPQGQQGIPGQNATLTTGKIVGFVVLYDPFFTALPDRSGVTVTIEGSAPAITATTDANGRFEFASQTLGTYNLVCSKTGFGTVTIRGIVHVGGTNPTLVQTSLGQVPAFSATLFAANSQATGQGSVLFTATSSVIPVQGGGVTAFPNYRLFISKTNDVSLSKFAYSTDVNFTYDGQTGSYKNPLTTTVQKGTLLANGFTSGNTAYAVLYPVNYGGSSNLDVATGVYSLSAFGTPTPVVSFLVP